MAKKVRAREYIPRWTKRVVTDLSGRDPLGLSRVAHALTDYLMRGIITTTNRARYYSFYCWVLDHIPRADDDIAVERYARAFQRREAAVALATLLATEQITPVGVRAARPKLEEAQETGKVDVGFRVLPSSPLGGYSQNYAGCMYELGLTHNPDADHDQLASEMAASLAGAFEEVIRPTAYFKNRLFNDDTFSLNQLEKSSPRLSLDALKRPYAKAERQLLIDLLFGFREPEPSESTLLRRQSLSRLLTLLTLYSDADVPVVESMLTEQLLDAPCYFGVLTAPDGSLYELEPVEWLELCSGFWRQFCLHQHVTLALEWLLYAVVEAIEATAAPTTLDDLIDALTQPGFREHLTSTRRARSSPRALLTSLGLAGVPDARTCEALRDRYPYEHPAAEPAILDRQPSAPAEAAATSLAMLAMLYAKWRAPPDNTVTRAVAHMAGAELWAGSVLPLLDDWWDERLGWQDALQRMIPRLILDQHDRVMYGKGRLESCWLHREGDQIMKDQDVEPARRASRVPQAMNMLLDLGLVRRSDGQPPSYAISAAGRRVLAKAEEAPR